LRQKLLRSSKSLIFGKWEFLFRSFRWYYVTNILIPRTIGRIDIFSFMFQVVYPHVDTCFYRMHASKRWYNQMKLISIQTICGNIRAVCADVSFCILQWFPYCVLRQIAVVITFTWDLNNIYCIIVVYPFSCKYSVCSWTPYNKHRTIQIREE